MSLAMRNKLADHFADKPDHLDMLFIDDHEQIRDRHIEDMFNICFDGGELDDIFVHNFKMYFEATAARYLPNPTMPPDEAFTDELLARAWITMNFGLLYVGGFKPDDPNRSDIDFDHCLFEAKLRTRLADNVNEACYAPTALHATFMTVVNVFRHLVHNYHNDIIEA